MVFLDISSFWGLVTVKFHPQKLFQGVKFSDKFCGGVFFLAHLPLQGVLIL